MKKYFLVLALFIFTFAFSFSVVSAQESKEAERARLEAELFQYEKEIKQKEAELAEQKKQTGSITKDISVLTKEIEGAKLKIKARGLVIQKLSDDINQKNKKIDTLVERMANQKESLAQLIRKTNELDDLSVVHLMLAAGSFSNVYNDLDSFSSVKDSLKKSVDDLKMIKSDTEEEKQSLLVKKDQEADAKAEIETQKKKVEVNEQQHKVLLGVSKKKEGDYQKLIAENKAKAAEIRARLFNLAGGSGAIPFGNALAFANDAASKTGVRAAVLLGILNQESRLGANTGSCYVTDYTTGGGLNAKTGLPMSRVMSPVRDVPHFLTITASLGRDPAKTLISCPQAIGWGGAMGPSQFIPSTWMIMKEKIKVALGISTNPDPWLPRDAFMATSLYLRDLGAGAQTFTAEKNAACRYYSGRTCTTANGSETYGKSVMAQAATFQATIDNLSTLEQN